MTSSAIALLLSGGFDDDAGDSSSSASLSFPPALLGIGGGACSLERWLSLPCLALPSRVLLVVAAGASERRLRSFLAALKRLSTSLDITIVVFNSREESGGGGQLAAAAKAAAAAAASPCSSSLVVADAAAVPLGLDLARLRAAASLLAAPGVVVSASPLGGACSKKNDGAEALRKTCRGLGRVSLLASSRGSSAAVARVAAFGGESGGDDDDDKEGLEAQRVAFLPDSSLQSAASHAVSVRSWLRAQGSSLRVLVASSASASASASASPSGGTPLPHASTAAGRALAAALLGRGSGAGGWGEVLSASGGADAWLKGLVASAEAAERDGEGDFGFEVEEEVERQPQSITKQQHSSFSTTSSTYGASAPPAVAAALSASSAAAAAAAYLRRGSGGSSISAAASAPSHSSSAASPSRRPSSSSLQLLPPLSPVLKTGSSGAAGGTLRFDIPRSRVHDKLDA